MPAKSQAQRGLIFGKRNKYKTKKNTPPKWKWIWDDEWENKGKLPERVEENRRIYDFETFNEKFFPKFKDKIKKWLDNPSSSVEKLLKTGFNDNEIKELENIGFKKLGIWHNYYSESGDFYITVEKYWDEVVPGSADSLYCIKVNDGLINRYNDFNDLLSKINEIIPDIEKNMSKYNL